MNAEEAMHLVTNAITTAHNAFEILEKAWPPDEKIITRAEALFDQSDAGIRDFFEATKKIDDRQFPEIRETKKECKIALKRHAKTLKMVREIISQQP